jgi:hypothetical protein
MLDSISKMLISEEIFIWGFSGVMEFMLFHVGILWMLVFYPSFRSVKGARGVFFSLKFSRQFDMEHAIFVSKKTVTRIFQS